jgi:hypothetical protein
MQRVQPGGTARQGSGGLAHATGANAGSADAHVLAHTVDDGLHAAQVRVPAAPTDVVRVANRVAKCGLLTANLTSECHSTLPARNTIHNELLIVAENRPHVKQSWRACR